MNLFLEKVRNFFNSKNGRIWGIVILAAVFFLIFLSSEIGMRKKSGYSLMGDEGVSVSVGGAYSSPGYLAEDFSRGFEGVSNEIGQPNFYPIEPISPSGAYADISPKDRQIVRSGFLSLVVKNAEESLSQIEVLAKDRGGFVENKSVSLATAKESGVYGTIVLRVPSEQFSGAMTSLKSLALKVEKEDISADDVTRQTVDLNARLKNLRAEEEQYTALLRRTGSIEDLVKVTSALSQVRGQIEQIESTLKYLSGSVSLSRITVSISAEADVKVFGLDWRPLSEIKRGVNNFLSQLIEYLNFLIRFVFALPILLLKLAFFVLAVWVLWRVALWAKGRFFPTAGA